MINFWHSIINGSENKLTFSLYKLLRALSKKGLYHSPWLLKIKNILNETGMSYMWDSSQICCHKWFSLTMKQNEMIYILKICCQKYIIMDSAIHTESLR